MKRKVWMLVVLALVLCPLVSSRADVKSKLDVMFYGYVKTDVVYQHGLGVMDNFLVWAMPGNLSQYPGGTAGRVLNQDFNSFSINSLQSRIGFLITAPEVNGIWSRGRIEMDFYGKFPGSAWQANYDVEPNKGSAMLRQATIEFGGANWSVLAGNAWMVTSPIFPHVDNYTYGAEIGNLGYRIPQVRFTFYAMEKALQFQIAVDDKIGDPGFQDIDTGRGSGKPTWEFGLLYEGKIGDKPLKLGVTGHTGVEGIPSLYRRAVTPYLIYNGREIASYSYNVHWIIPIGPLSLSGEYYQGANLDGWFTGAQGKGWIYNARHNEYEPMRSTGGWLELMYKAKTMELIGGYGVDDIDDSQLDRGRAIVELIGTSSNNAITRNEMYWAALNYYLNPQTMISFEWTQVLTTYDLANPSDCAASGAATLDWNSGMVNRYTISFWFYF